MRLVDRARFLAEESPRAVERAVLVIGREDFVAWIELKAARDDVESRRRIRHVDEIVGVRVYVRGERCARLAHEIVKTASEEFDRLAFELELPPLVLVKDRSQRRAERTVIQKSDVGIEKK